MKGLPTNAANSPFALALYYSFKVIPMLIGGMSVYLGYRLFILGVTGQASLSISNKNVSGQLLNAAPGLFFALAGIAANIAAVWKGVNISFEKESPRYHEISTQVYAEELGKKDWGGPHQA